MQIYCVSDRPLRLSVLILILAATLLSGLAAAPPAMAQPSPHARLMLPPGTVLPPGGAAQTTTAPLRLQSGEQLVDRGIYRLDGLAADLPHTDLAPLRQILEGAQVVGLGETIHTSGGYYAMKHRLFRFLVEEMGFRAFAMETPWPYAEVTAQYVATCQGSVNAAMGWIFSVFASEETGALLTYMCTWNQAHPNDPITFFGFDTQQPEMDGPALIAFLQGVGLEDDDPRIVGLRRCDGVVTFEFPVSDENNEACLAALDAVDALLTELDPSDAVQHERAEVEWAKIRSIGLRAWQGEEYYFDRDFPRAYTSRDRGMASVLQRIRKLKVGSQKTAVWAHNSHIGKGGYQFEERGFTVMGDWLSREMGHRYASVALAAAQVGVEWPWVFRCGMFDAAPDSAEKLLQQLGEPYLLVDLDFHGTNPAHPPFLDPDEPILIGSNLYIPRDHHDALIYLDVSPPMTPVFWRPCA
jgi:erythromycin esterase